MKIIIHYFLLFVALVATTGCDKDDNYYPAPEFEGDPTAEYIEANVDFDTQISQENSDPDTFYTYFCLCNASDHKIYFTLTFCPTKNDEFIDHMNGLVDPGKKYTNRFVTSNWSMDVPGLITTFSPLITEMEVYYDVDDKYGPVRFPSGIEEKYSDFTQRFKTRQICDPAQRRPFLWHLASAFYAHNFPVWKKQASSRSAICTVIPTPAFLSWACCAKISLIKCLTLTI